MRIGVLEDDHAQQEMYQLWFSTAQHDCVCFDTARSFVEALDKQIFDLLIIDWELPDSNGEIVLRHVRETLGWEIPVLFITARDAEADIVNVLRAGADDYVVKPPKYLELLARIQALGRRAKPPAIQKIGVYQIDRESRQIRVNDQPVELTTKEFELACYMMTSPGKLLSRVHLLDKIWGLNANVETRTIDTHVSRIRRKLQLVPENGWEIIPVYGYGYRIEKVERATASAKS
ncbi:response regulator transcription factor [Thauera aromatica]|uniref:response regulator transcription factor n=1 Tax=Thauera aromatica TaxID=59405 RepID=UPI001FFD721A|nr:response regulator transcription factor [Thauera aromatica]MCK2086713.1 response regulator transcription factor [Thauera aromatica]